MWWQTLIVALSSSVVGGLLSLVGADVLARRRAVERRRADAVRAVGVALAALRQINPETWGDRLLDRTSEDAQAAMSTKHDQWLAAAADLEVLAASHSDARVRELAERVIDRGDLVRVRLDEVAHGSDIDEEWRMNIPEAYATAVDAARELLNVVKT